MWYQKQDQEKKMSQVTVLCGKKVKTTFLYEKWAGLLHISADRW